MCTITLDAEEDVQKRTDADATAEATSQTDGRVMHDDRYEVSEPLIKDKAYSYRL